MRRPLFSSCLSLSASSRACAAASDRRTVTRSGRRRSTATMSRDRIFFSRSSATSRSSACSTLVFRQPHVDPVLQPQIPAPLSHQDRGAQRDRGFRDSGRAWRENPWPARSAPRADHERQAAVSVLDRTARAPCRRRRSTLTWPSFCHSAKAWRSVIADLQAVGIELEHARIGDPRDWPSSRARAAVGVEEQQRRRARSRRRRRAPLRG